MQQVEVVGPARLEGLRTGGSAMAEAQTNADKWRAELTLPKRRLLRKVPMGRHFCGRELTLYLKVHT